MLYSPLSLSFQRSCKLDKKSCQPSANPNRAGLPHGVVNQTDGTLASRFHVGSVKKESNEMDQHFSRDCVNILTLSRLPQEVVKPGTPYSASQFPHMYSLKLRQGETERFMGWER